MKKLRPTVNEKVKFIEDLTEQLAWFNKGALSDFNFDDLLKEYSKIPENVKKPTLIVTADAYVRMLELVNQSAVECSWHGLVKRNKEENKYLIYDILVFPQRNSATSTTTDEKEFAEWQTSLIMDMNFPIEDLRMHGHSHVNMNVFSSGIDDKYQKDLITKVEDGDYYIFLIMNKKMEICMFIYDFDQQIMFDKNDIDFQIINIEYFDHPVATVGDIREWAKKELKEKAITTTVTSSKSPYYSDPRRKGYYEDEETCISYFSKSTPIFKGANNGLK